MRGPSAASARSAAGTGGAAARIPQRSVPELLDLRGDGDARLLPDEPAPDPDPPQVHGPNVAGGPRASLSGRLPVATCDEDPLPRLRGRVRVGVAQRKQPTVRRAQDRSPTRAPTPNPPPAGRATGGGPPTPSR